MDKELGTKLDEISQKLDTLIYLQYQLALRQTMNLPTWAYKEQQFIDNEKEKANKRKLY